MIVPYQWRKALINGSQILIGVIAVRLTPYVPQLTMGVWPNDLTLQFFKHILISAILITGVAEFRYFYKWIMSLNGGNDAQKSTGNPSIS